MHSEEPTKAQTALLHIIARYQASLHTMENLSKEASYWLMNGSWTGSSQNESRAKNRIVSPVKRNEDVAKVEVAVLFVVLVLALAGNLFVLTSLCTSKRTQSRMHFFMKHLSIADLVVAIFQVLPQLIWDITFRFYGPDLLCRLVKYLQIVGMFASTYLLVLMSVDRCLAVCQPLRALHQRKDWVNVLALWILSLFLSLPQVYIFSLKEVSQGVFDCWGDFAQPWGAKAYVTWISLVIYVVPVTILSVCYGLTSFKIWQNFKLKSRRQQQITRQPPDSMALSHVSSVRLISKAKIRTVKMTFVVVLAYVVCWTPFFFVQMWSAWDPMAPREAMAFIIAMLLASLSSCCNPWIYMSFAGHLFHDLVQHCKMTSQCGCVAQKSPKTQSIIMVKKSSQRSLTQTTYII